MLFFWDLQSAICSGVRFCIVCLIQCVKLQAPDLISHSNISWDLCSYTVITYGLFRYSLVVSQIKLNCWGSVTNILLQFIFLGFGKELKVMSGLPKMWWLAISGRVILWMNNTEIIVWKAVLFRHSGINGLLLSALYNDMPPASISIGLYNAVLTDVYFHSVEGLAPLYSKPNRHYIAAIHSGNRLGPNASPSHLTVNNNVYVYFYTIHF